MSGNRKAINFVCRGLATTFILFLAGTSHSLELEGSVRAVVDYPDSCSGLAEVPMGQIQVVVSNGSNEITGATAANGKFRIDVSSLGSGPFDVKSFLISRVGSTTVFTVDNRDGADGLAQSVCSSGCNLVFNDQNSTPAERTAYFWVRKAIDMIESRYSSCADFSGLAVWVNEDLACNAGAEQGVPRIVFSDANFPCGNLGRVATIVCHELNHKLEDLSRTTPQECEFGSATGEEARSDAFGFMVLKSLGLDEPHTGIGFYRTKCTHGIRQHDILRRHPEDSFGGLDGEILSGFFWDALHASNVPTDAVIQAYLKIVCRSGNLGLDQQTTVTAFCDSISSSYDSVLSGIASSHGFDWCRSARSERLGNSNASQTKALTGITQASPTLEWSISPNPFDPRIEVAVGSPRDVHMTLSIYDVSGRLLRKLYSGPVSAGTHIFHWNGKDNRDVSVGVGVYFLVLDAEGGSTTKKILRIK